MPFFKTFTSLFAKTKRNFEKKTECDLEEYRALQNRIEELKSELEDPWDDDDDGDVPSIIKR